MKVLVLSCNTGQGHNSAGKAVYETMLRRGVDCEMLDALSLAGQAVSRRVSNVYTGITTRFPAGFGMIYRAGRAVSSNRRKSVVYLANRGYAGNLRRYIEENGFDRVVTPHLFPAEALTCLRREGGLKIRCYAVATDYTCIPFWEETELDYYCIPHRELLADFEQKGIPAEKLLPTGIPVSPRFRCKTPPLQARRELQFDEAGRYFLIMTGSMGFGNVQALAEQLLLAGSDVHAVILAGTNRKLKETLRRRFSDEKRILTLDYTDQVSLYMDACDLLFTKPGGLTSTEAAVKNIPFAHTDPIPGCESCNAAFFAKHGLALCCADYEELVHRAIGLIRDPAARDRMLAAQRQVINPRAADDICDLICG